MASSLVFSSKSFSSCESSSVASSLVFSSKISSSRESSSAGHMNLQRLPAGSSGRTRNVRFRRCFKVRAMQVSLGAEAAISDQGRMDSKNLYEILEIDPAATVKDIKRAYRKLAREIHPDQAASPEEKKKSTQMFLRIHNAYVTLSDPRDRALYDRQLLVPMRGFAGQAWSKANNGRPTTYGYCGHWGRSWESDQCW